MKHTHTQFAIIEWLACKYSYKCTHRLYHCKTSHILRILRRHSIHLDHGFATNCSMTNWTALHYIKFTVFELGCIHSMRNVGVIEEHLTHRHPPTRAHVVAPTSRDIYSSIQNHLHVDPYFLQCIALGPDMI